MDAANAHVAPPYDLRNLTHSITRALLQVTGFKPQLHRNYDESIDNIARIERNCKLASYKQCNLTWRRLW